MPPAVLRTELRSLPLVGRGKVRDIYAAGPERLLLVQTDRISAFDIVLDEGIPGKGEALTAMSRFWFDRWAAFWRIIIWTRIRSRRLPRTSGS